jgi:hypothetical protein
MAATDVGKIKEKCFFPKKTPVYSPIIFASITIPKTREEEVLNM